MGFIARLTFTGMPTYLPQLDVTKVIMAVIVVAIHTQPQSLLGESLVADICQSLYEIPVPFFFAVSGFLLWRKMGGFVRNDRLIRIENWILHSLRLYFLWTIIYLPYTIYGFVHDGLQWHEALMVFARNVLLVGENYCSWPLWYLLGMVSAGCVIYGIVKVGLGVKSILLVAVVLLCLGEVLDSLCQREQMPAIVSLYYKVFKSTRNGFFLGLPYIAVGVCIAEFGIVRSRGILAALFTSFLCLFLKYGGRFFLLLLVCFGLQLLLGLVWRTTAHGRITVCRKVSNIIYFTHMIWVGLMMTVFPVDNSLLRFSLSVLMTLVTSFFLIGKHEGKVFNKLFS